MSELSPRDIIAALDVAVIDASIEELNDELAALKALRKVAEAKGKIGPSRGNGRESGGGTKSPSRSHAERCESSLAVLREHGPMPFEDLCEKLGIDGRGSRWMRKSLSEDSRFTLNGDEVSLSNGLYVTMESSEE